MPKDSRVIFNIRPTACRILLLIFCFLFILAACRENNPSEPINIGLILYEFDDSGSNLDFATLYGAEMAVETIRSAGGILINNRRHEVNLVVEKVSTSSEDAVTAARELINRERVVALIGPQYSSGAIPVGAIAEAAMVPMISPSSTHPDTTRNRKYVFRMSFLDDLQGRVMANFAREELKVSRAAVIYNESEPYSRGIANVFRKEFTFSGGEVVAYEAFVSGETVQPRQLDVVRVLSPEVIFLPVFQEDLEKAVSKIRKVGISARLLGSDTWEQDKLAHIPDFDDSYITNSWNKDIPTDETVTFVREYVDRFGIRPNGDSALTFDAFQLVFKAIAMQQSYTPEAIQQGLYLLAPHRGASGEIDFVSSGDPAKGVVVMHINKGKSSFFKVYKPGEIKTKR